MLEPDLLSPLGGLGVGGNGRVSKAHTHKKRDKRAAASLSAGAAAEKWGWTRFPRHPGMTSRAWKNEAEEEEEEYHSTVQKPPLFIDSDKSVPATPCFAFYHKHVCFY